MLLDEISTFLHRKTQTILSDVFVFSCSQKLRPTIHEIIVSKIKPHMETTNLSKYACSQGDRSVATELHIYKRTVRGLQQVIKREAAKWGIKFSNSPGCEPCFASHGSWRQSTGCSKRTSSLDFGCIVKIFREQFDVELMSIFHFLVKSRKISLTVSAIENHVVVGELLELKATQHDIETTNSLPTDVNWNTGSEASQVTGGYTQFSLEQSHRNTY